jgi:hypothetical protein
MTSKRSTTSKRGAQISDDVAERLADEAEQGYDLSRAKRVGRPSLGGPGASPRLNVRVSQELYAALLERAEAAGVKVSELVRDILERHAVPKSRR